MDHGTPLDSRILSVAYIPAMAAIIIFLWRSSLHPNPWVIRAIMFYLVLVTLIPGLFVFKKHYTHGAKNAYPSWQENCIVKHLKGRNIDNNIYTYWPEPIFFLAGPKFVTIPNMMTRGKPNPRYKAQLKNTLGRIKDGDLIALIGEFNTESPKEKFPEIGDLTKDARLEILFECQDGVIYKISK
jgi:hypothetical protein